METFPLTEPDPVGSSSGSLSVNQPVVPFGLLHSVGSVTGSGSGSSRTSDALLVKFGWIFQNRSGAADPLGLF